MTLYERKINRNPSGLDENERILSAYEKILLAEANLPTVDEFIKSLEGAVRKIFPKSFVQIYASTNLGASITFKFALGKDKSEWANGIIQNDPLFHTWMIGWNSFTEGHFIKDKIEADLSVGGSLKIKPEEGSYLAFGRVKIGWRKKTATPDKIIQHFENYFKKMQQVLKSNKDKLPDEDKNLNKNKL
jgi:hypothetical protein